MGQDESRQVEERTAASGTGTEPEGPGAVADPGRERTEADFADLFERSGLRLSHVLPTATVLSVVEAVPA